MNSSGQTTTTDTGVAAIGQVPWGTHFCQFYRAKQDLLDTLVPYFQHGLQQNELCVWITSEPLGVADATSALRKAVPDLDDRLGRGQIEILDYRQCYAAAGEFLPEPALRGWIAKEREALERGYEGLRFSGNSSWLEKRDWLNFTAYEAQVNAVIGRHRMLALCTYPLDKCGARELVDVVGNHQFSLIEQSGQWRIIDTAAQERDAFTRALLELFARKAIRKEYLDAVVEMLRGRSGCRCVGVRVADDKGCIPYESYIGFSREFWELENWLRLDRDACACTRIIAQKPEPQDAAVMTPGGSFRCDNAARFIAGLTPDQRTRYRGHCVRNGFLTLAIVPIRYRGRVLGVIHLADEREGLAPAAFVELLELMTPLIGEAIHRFSVEERLQSLHEALAGRARQLQTLASQLTLAEQRERRRLAQVLHDHLQQLLYAARLSVGTLRRRTRDAELQGTIQQVDDVLNQCIMESRSLTVEISPPILYDVGLAAALEWLARHVQQTYGLAVAVEADPAAEPETEDMRVLLFQSVRELLFNVVKHAGVRRAEVTMLASSTQEVQITVTDEGAGFDPGESRIGQWAGTGFGLFSIRERLELMGGTLTLDATPGQGTQVTISAPRQPFAQAAESTPIGDETASATDRLPAECALTDGAGRIRVLLVDDHAIFRKGVADLLREEPAVEVVGEAADGEMAIDMAVRINPDVILMDVSMPRLGGIEATQRITDLLPGVRVVGLSACEAENVRDQFRAAGAAAYLSKTCHPETLIAAIRGAAPNLAQEV